jgi:hypothetical protein
MAKQNAASPRLTGSKKPIKTKKAAREKTLPKIESDVVP